MTFSKTRWALAAAASILVSASGAAQAAQGPTTTPTPDMPSTSVQVVGSTEYTDPYLYSYALDKQEKQIYNATGGSQDVSISETHGYGKGSSFASASAQVVHATSTSFVDANSRQLFVASASGEISYYLTVTGPTSGAQDVVVPLHLFGAYQISSSISSSDARAGATAYNYLNGDATVTSGPQYFSALCSGGDMGQCGAGTFSTGFTLNAFANGQYGGMAQITLGVTTNTSADNFIAYNYNYDGGTGTAEGFIDPMISIDADWLAVNPGFDIHFSENVLNGAGPTGGVPEPASWALMIAGFGLAGAALRRRRAGAVFG